MLASQHALCGRVPLPGLVADACGEEGPVAFKGLADSWDRSSIWVREMDGVSMQHRFAHARVSAGVV